MYYKNPKFIEGSLDCFNLVSIAIQPFWIFSSGLWQISVSLFATIGYLLFFGIYFNNAFFQVDAKIASDWNKINYYDYLDNINFKCTVPAIIWVLLFLVSLSFHLLEILFIL